MPYNRYGIDVMVDYESHRDVQVNTITQIGELLMSETARHASLPTHLEVYDRANCNIMEIYYDPPPGNQFFLRHVNHPVTEDDKDLEKYTHCMRAMEKFTQERFGEWQGRYWKYNEDPGAINKACDELWEYVETNHRETIRAWKAMLDRRNRASELLMVKMGIRLCRRTDGVDHYMIETADEDPPEDEFTLAKIFAADTPAKLARAMLKQIPTLREAEDEEIRTDVSC